MYRLVFLLLCFLFLSSTGYADTLPAPKLSYCENADSTADQIACVTKRRDAAQEGLTETYRALVEALQGHNEEQADALRLSQTRWLEYRNTECDWEAGHGENPVLEQLYRKICTISLTESRSDVLSMFLEDRDGARDYRNLRLYPRWMNVLSDKYPEIFWNHRGRIAVDLDCDGFEERIMSGLFVVSDAEFVRQGVQGVLAIVKNPTSGRPEPRLVKLPVTRSRPEAQTEALCSPSVALRIVPAPGDVEGKGCFLALQLSDPVCGLSTLFWNGEDYVFLPREATAH